MEVGRLGSIFSPELSIVDDGIKMQLKTGSLACWPCLSLYDAIYLSF